MDPWTKPKYRSWLALLQKNARGKVRMNAAVCELNEEEREVVLRVHSRVLRLIWKPRNTKYMFACS